MSARRKHIVFLESNYTTGLEAVRQARQTLGYEVSFITSDLAVYLFGRPLSESPLREADRIVEVEDSADPNRLWKTVERLHREHPIDGFFTFYDTHVPTASVIAERLGLPTLSANAARRARDKAETRRLGDLAGVEQPRYREVMSEAEAVIAAQDIGLPVILKPADGTASLNTALARCSDEVIRNYRRIQAYGSYGRGIVASRRVLVEEFVEGPLVSVECVTVGGKHHVLGITDRRLGGEPFFVELGGSFPSSIRGGRKAIATAKQALDAIGFDFGASHTEIVLGKHGPRLVEINPRLVGGFVPDMIDATLGCNVLLDLIRLHVGETVEISARPRGVATIHAFRAERAGVVRAVLPSERARGPSVLRYALLKRPGDPVRPVESNHDRLGYVVVLGADAGESEALAARIAEETRFVIG
jgi:argininosuccinate lyase